MTTKTEYREALQTLSEASVHQHFDAFLDIAWDSPEMAVDMNDPRWVLPDYDIVGGSDWYLGLPVEEQIRVGRYRMAQICKVGLQFEQVLISGLTNYAARLPNDSAEFRYATHEATEETHHTQMFQEFVNRVDPTVKGGPRWFRAIAPLLPLAAGPLPAIFFVGVLAGEEPIDHLQKEVLRGGGTHPLTDRIMQIHVAEEARHIGFAHQWLHQRVERLGPINRVLVTVSFPVIMRVLGDVIMKPTPEMLRDIGMPREVAKDLYWRNPKSQKVLSDLFADVRMLADELGVRGRVGKAVWRAMKIDGRPARFRGEPSRLG
jgi:hypothetical protein